VKKKERSFRSPFDLVFPSATIALVAFVVLPPLLLLSLSLSQKFDLLFGLLPDGLTLEMYESVWPGFLGSARDSLLIAVPTLVLSILLGVPAAFGLVRSEFPGKAVALEVLNFPMLFPPVVLAFGIFQLFRAGPFPDVSTWFVLVLAHTTVATPLMIRPLMASLQRIDPAPEEAAASLGANRVRAFIDTALPAIFPSFMAGVVLVFARSISDFEITLLLVDPQVRPLTIAVFNAFETGSARMGAAMAMAANIFTILVIVLLETGVRKTKWGSRP
jgi:ABC-type spermidine/putrescine transport system permease subunit II